MILWKSRIKALSRIRKIRTKFLLFILIPTLVILVISWGVSFVITEHSLAKQLRLLGAFAIQQATDEIEFGAVMGLSTLKGLAAQDKIMSPTDEQWALAFKDVTERLHMGPIFLAFPDGRFVSSLDPSQIPEGYDPRKEKWYRRGAQSDEVQLMLPYESKITKGKNGKVFAAVLRINNPDGSLKGVMGYEVSSSTIRWKMTKIKALQEDTDIVFSMIFQDGSYLHHTDTKWIGKKVTDWNDRLHNDIWQAVRSGKSEWEGLGDTEEGKYFAAFRKLRSGPIYVVLEMAKCQALMPIFRLMVAYIALGLCALGAITYILVAHARAITHPLEELSGAAARLTDGDYEHKLPVTTR